jgi:hypothetical protein
MLPSVFILAIDPEDDTLWVFVSTPIFIDWFPLAIRSKKYLYRQYRYLHGGIDMVASYTLAPTAFATHNSNAKNGDFDMFRHSFDVTNIFSVLIYIKRIKTLVDIYSKMIEFALKGNSTQLWP